jgi:hypothetical protein
MLGHQVPNAVGSPALGIVAPRHIFAFNSARLHPDSIMPPLPATLAIFLHGDPNLPRQSLRWSLALALAAAVLVAFVMSTKLLAQPFVWRNFPPGEVLAAWLDMLGQRLAVAVSIAVAVTLSFRVPLPRIWQRAALLVLAIVVGALVGESALVAEGAMEGPPDRLSALLRLLQWCTLAVSISSLVFVWQRASGAEAARQSSDLRRVQIERQLVQARLQSLRQQIEPHFLFNTLATVRRLQHTGDQGDVLLSHFVAYLRSTLPTGTDSEGPALPRADTLGRELDLVRAYMGIIEVRMGGRLRVQFSIEEGLQHAEFPPLTLATLVENAIKHGIAPAPEGGTITIHAHKAGTQLVAGVTDTGVGFSGSGGSGMGLANIRARLRALYGDSGSLALAANPPGGVCASIRLPFNVGKVSAA